MRRQRGGILLLAGVVAVLILGAWAATGSGSVPALSAGIPVPTGDSCQPWTCPTLTPEPLLVDPVTSPTYVRSQVVRVWLGNGEVVTITAESGVFTATDGFWPAEVEVALLPGVTHHLAVAGRVQVGPPPCCYGGYTLSTTDDRYGNPLIIQHQPLPARLYLPLIGHRWVAGPAR
jgi:hypothetical protein